MERKENNGKFLLNNRSNKMKVPWYMQTAHRKRVIYDIRYSDFN